MSNVMCDVCDVEVLENKFHRHKRSRRHLKNLLENDTTDEINCRTILNGKTIRCTNNKLLYDIIFPSYKSVVRQWTKKCDEGKSCIHAECKDLFGYKSIIKINEKDDDLVKTIATSKTSAQIPHQLLSSLSRKLYEALMCLQKSSTSIPPPSMDQSSSTPTLVGINKPYASTWSVDDAMAIVNGHAILHKGQIIHPPPAPSWEECIGASSSTSSSSTISTGITNHVHAIIEYFNIFYNAIKIKMEQMLEIIRNYKMNIILHLKLIKLNEKQLVKISTDDPFIITPETNLDDVIHDICMELTSKFDNLEFTRNSGWSLKSINGIELQVSEYNKLFGSSRIKGAHHDFKLPKYLNTKKALINVQGGENGDCFREAIGVKLMLMRGEHKNLGRASLYKDHSKAIKRGRKSNSKNKGLYDNLDFSMTSVPTELDDVKAFEEGNGVCINIFAYDNDKKQIYPLHVGKFSNLTQESQQKLIENGGNTLTVDGIWDLLYLDPTQVGRTDRKNKTKKGTTRNTTLAATFIDCEAIDDDDDNESEGEGNSDFDSEIENDCGHFVFIKDLSRLLQSQLTRNNNRKVICRSCLHYYSTKGFTSHLEKCEANIGVKGNNAVQPIMPGEHDMDNTKLKFNLTHKKYEIEVPYVIYADFETALIEKIGKRDLVGEAESESDDEEPYLNTVVRNTSVVHVHEPTSFCYLIVSRNSSDMNKYTPIVYRGENAVSVFWKSIEQEVNRIGKICSQTNLPIKMSDEELSAIRDTAVKCFLCEENFTVDSVKVVDHDHFSGQVRGIAHSKCNLLYRRSHFVPVVFHNGSSYDFKLIIKEIVNSNVAYNKSISHSGKKNINISVIASSTETIISFEKKWKSNFAPQQGPMPGSFGGGRMSIQFIDSMRFLNSSLSTLASNLSPELKRQTRLTFPNDKMFNMACRKGIFPYEHIQSLESYNEPSLPPIEAFSSSLNSGKTISKEDYQFACEFFLEFNCKNLGEYSDEYLRIDVLLLSDIFENFRNLCLDIYKLDPLWHYSAPGLSWNAMLKTGISRDVELITQYDHYLFAESAVRGGLCTVSKRLVEANNPRMKELYNDQKPTNYLTYFDANNLYGYSMCMPMPSGEYRWFDDGSDENNVSRLEEIIKLINNWNEESSTGYFLEVDLDYPSHLHTTHNDFPLCPERVCTPQTGNNPKLINTLFNKRKYVTHVAYLKHVLAQGLVLKQVYRVLCFAQRPWLAEYIHTNTEHRKKATSKFDIEFFKLMNNVIFGKCLENVRGRRDIRLVFSDVTIKNLVADPRFKRRIILNEETNLCLIEMGRKVVTFDKPVCIGATILDLSKCVMANFHYNIMKPLLPNAQLCYHDTDSLIYDIPCENRLDDIYTGILLDNRDLYFDFSSLPTTHPLYSDTNRKVPGKFSDELSGSIGIGFVALRPKVYSLKLLEEQQVCSEGDSAETTLTERVIKKAKGTKKNVVEMSLNYDLYKRVLSHGATVCANGEAPQSDLDNLEPRGLYVTQYNIQSHHMELRTVKMRKLALSWNDDKRYICPDGVHTFAWGHNALTVKTSSNPYSCIPESQRAELVYREGHAPILVFPSLNENLRAYASSSSESRKNIGKRGKVVEGEVIATEHISNKKMRISSK